MSMGQFCVEDIIMYLRPIRDASVEAIARVYRAAFAGFPWFEELSSEEVVQRLQTLFLKPGLDGVVALEGDRVVGAHWYDIISLAQIRADRGNELADWIINYGFEERLLVWERELIVHPDFQRRGLSYEMRAEFLQHLKEFDTPILVLTRLREDNIGSIKSAERIAMRDTGVTKPASQAPLLHHYWALSVG